MLELELIALQIVLNTTAKSLAQLTEGEKNGSRKTTGNTGIGIQGSSKGNTRSVCDDTILERAG